VPFKFSFAGLVYPKSRGSASLDFLLDFLPGFVIFPRPIEGAALQLGHPSGFPAGIEGATRQTLRPQSKRVWVGTPLPISGNAGV